MKRVAHMIGLGIDVASVALFVTQAMSGWGATTCILRMVPIVVAAKDLPEGVVIDRAAVVVQQWPMGAQPARYYTSIDSVVGRVAGRAIRQGGAVVPSALPLPPIGADPARHPLGE
jgi:Flp pilus assembly protein CpaB